MIASAKVAAGVGKLVLFIVSKAQMPTSSAMPAIGGSTLSHSSLQSNGGLARGTRATTGGGAAFTIGTGLASTLARASAATSSGEWNTALTIIDSLQLNQAEADLMRKLSAYFLGSLPSQTLPSTSLLVRSGSFGTLTFNALAAS